MKLEGEIVIDKGTLERVDSYSGFGSAPEVTKLKEELDARGVKTIYCAGLAFDYCVGATAIDGAKLGYKTYLVTDATKSVSPQNRDMMEKRLRDAGVIFLKCDEALA